MKNPWLRKRQRPDEVVVSRKALQLLLDKGVLVVVRRGDRQAAPEVVQAYRALRASLLPPLRYDDDGVPQGREE